jgi:hypothetical protein
MLGGQLEGEGDGLERGLRRSHTLPPLGHSGWAKASCCVVKSQGRLASSFPAHVDEREPASERFTRQYKLQMARFDALGNCPWGQCVRESVMWVP